MNWNQFEIGFWHPFGQHGGETRDHILRRKAEEISRNSWTLWSFQFRRAEWLRRWSQAIDKSGSSSVFVLCSDSRGQGNSEPQGTVSQAQHYSLVDDIEWRSVPETISIPHPFGSKERATAYMVKRIIHPSHLSGRPDFFLQWLLEDGSWSNARPSTRGEWLIRRGAGTAVGSVYAVLELQPPYIVNLRK